MALFNKTQQAVPVTSNVYQDMMVKWYTLLNPELGTNVLNPGSVPAFVNANPVQAPGPATKPVATLPDIQEEFDAELLRRHDELREKLGFFRAIDPEEVRVRVRNWFAREGIPLFDPAEVTEYMNKTYPEKWSPNWNPKSSEATMSPWGSSNHYTQPIPIHVLELAGRVAEQFPSVSFNVWAPGLPKADPFMQAWIDGQGFIFAVWDEPGFVAKETK